MNSTDTEREKGILNTRERAYLSGSSDIEPKTQQERDIRSTIRGHLTNAIIDAELIMELLEPRDGKQVVDNLSAYGYAEESAIGLLCGLAYWLCSICDHSFEDAATNGIRQVAVARDLSQGPVEVTLSKSAPVDIEQLGWKVEQGRLSGFSELEKEVLINAIISSKWMSSDEIEVMFEELGYID